MKYKKIIAVIVTYNRLELLKRAIKYVQNQTYALTEIIVINNGSTDGTSEWLAQENKITVINQANVGGAGGFYTGIKTAYTHGADWIWCMDDDVYPTDSCLDTLLSYVDKINNIGIICPRRLQNGAIVYGETKSFNLTNPLRPLNNFLSENEVGREELVQIEGMAFEGPLISRSVVDRIGYPNRDLFIFFDDSDYSYRAVLAGFYVMYCKNAILNKELFPVKKMKAKEYRNNWKLFYDIRNKAFFSKSYGKNKIFRVCGGFEYPLHALCGALVSLIFNLRKYRIKDLKWIVCSFINGKRKILGLMRF